MNLIKRLGLLSSVILLTFFQAAAQDTCSVAEWYLNFFATKSELPVESLLALKEDQYKEAVESHDDSAAVFTLIEKGLIQLTYKFDNAKAMDQFIQSMAVSDDKNIPEGKIFTYLALSHVFELSDNHAKRLEFVEKALPLSAALKDKKIHVLVLNEAGKVYAANQRDEDALESFNKALVYYPYLNEVPVLHATVLYNMASVYEAMHAYSDALDNLKKSLSVRRSIQDRRQEAFLLNRIGAVYNLQGNKQRAMANFKAALEVNKAISDKEGVADSYNNIGILYLEQGDAKQAILNLELALTSAGTSSTSKSVSYLNLGKAYASIGDFKQALKNKDLYIAMNDFIQKEINDQLLLELKSSYDIKQKEAEIDRQELLIAQEKREKNQLAIILGLAFVVACLVGYMYLQKRRINKQLKAINAKVEAQNIELQNLNATKDKFFSILGHDLKGPLNSLTSFSNLLINYFDSLSKEEIQTLAKDLDKSIKNLFSLLNNLLEWARSQTGNIDFTPSEFDVSTVLVETGELLAAQAAAKQIQIRLEPTQDLIVSAHKQSITTVIRNLISNAIKFTPPGGVITVHAGKVEGAVRVSVADNGVGMSKAVMDKLFRLDAKHSTLGTAQEKGTGLGLILCKDFVEKNGGNIGVNSEEGKGSEFYFTVPLR